MAWLLLFSAGFVEIIFALSLKYNQGFSKLWPSIVTAISGIGSFGLLMWALKTLPLGTAYAVWTGMGRWVWRYWALFCLKNQLTGTGYCPLL